MGNNVNTQPSKGEIYPGVDVLSFGAPVKKIRENAQKLTKAAKAYVPKITDFGKTILTKQNGDIVRYSAETKKPFKSKEKLGMVKSIVSSANVKGILERLFARKYANKDNER